MLTKARIAAAGKIGRFMLQRYGELPPPFVDNLKINRQMIRNPLRNSGAFAVSFVFLLPAC